MTAVAVLALATSTSCSREAERAATPSASVDPVPARPDGQRDPAWVHAFEPGRGSAFAATLDVAARSGDGVLLRFETPTGLVELGEDLVERPVAPSALPRPPRPRDEQFDEGCVESAGLVVAPRGNAVAVPMLSDPAHRGGEQAQPMTRVLDEHGRLLLLDGRAEVQGRGAAFSGDGASLLVLGDEGSARVYDLRSGKLAWAQAAAGTSSTGIGFGAVVSGALDATGRRVAMVTEVWGGRIWIGESDGLQVMAWDIPGRQLLMLADLRWDDLGVPRSRGLTKFSTLLSDDGAWLLVSAGDALLLFRLP